MSIRTKGIGLIAGAVRPMKKAKIANVYENFCNFLKVLQAAGENAPGKAFY